jgi:chromosome segregation ATPase
MGSGSAEAAAPAAEWERLERAGEAAARAVTEWRARAHTAEAEVERLRSTLQQTLEGEAGAPLGDAQRLRAENTLLRSRMEEASRRVNELLGHLRLLEERP